MSKSYEIRIIDISDADIEIGAERGSDLNHLIGSDAPITSSWRKQKSWEDFFLAELYSAVRNIHIPNKPTSRWAHFDPQNLIRAFVEADGGEQIFTSYIDRVANAMRISNYLWVPPELQERLRTSFIQEFVQPTAQLLYENAEPDKRFHDQGLEEVKTADSAAEAYLAARG